MKTLNANLIQVVNILSDGHYHDGTTLGASVGMTRSAVWKVIQKLISLGVKIDSIKGKGYALQEPLILLDEGRIKYHGSTNNITILETTDSTNRYLKFLKPSNAPQICLAEQQTAGKGRLNRTWYSPFAKNIYFSCRYPFSKDISELAGLSLVVSLAIIHTLKSYGLSDYLLVKWPNDILFADKKLSGTLIEIQAETHGLSHAIIGIGINVNMLNDDQQIAKPWTSLQTILGTYIDRNELCARLLTSLFTYLQQFTTHGFSHFLAEWQANDYLLHRHIAIQHHGQTTHGKVTGINTQGHLLLQHEDGNIQAFSSGDTSVMQIA